MMHLLRCWSVKYVNLRLTILARFISFKFRLSFALFSRCFSDSEVDSVTNKLLFRKTWKERHKAGNFFTFTMYIIRCKFYIMHKTQHKHNTAMQNFTPHTHSIICNGSFIHQKHFFKSLFVKMGNLFNVLKWCLQIVRDCVLMNNYLQNHFHYL